MLLWCLDKERELERLANVYKKTNKKCEELRASVQHQKDKKMKEDNSCYHSKIYTQVEGKTFLFEIIIGYYVHIMLLQASACKKKTLKASTRG